MSLSALKAPFLVLALITLHTACDPRRQGPGSQGAAAQLQPPGTGQGAAPLAVPPIKVDMPVVTAFSEDHWAQIEGDANWTYEWNLEGGRVVSGASASVVRFEAADPGKVALRCKVRNAQGQETTVTLDLTVLPMPFLGGFQANPPIITKGDKTTLSWEVRDASSLQLEPEGKEVSRYATLQLQPMETTTYILKATNLAGSRVEKSLLLQVVPPPVIRSFGREGSAAPAQPLILKADFAAGRAEIKQGSSVLASSSESPLQVQVNPTTGTVYTLVVTNEAGATMTQTLTVSMQALPN